MAKKRARKKVAAKVTNKADKSVALVDPTFLFRFSAPLYRAKQLWSKSGIQLSKKHVIPSFAELSGNAIYADLRAAWNDDGLGLTLRVAGKKTTPWCRASRPEDSDGLHVFIDTRDTHSIHRASRFCHHFVFLPFGGGRGQDEPVGKWLPINRAREVSQEVEDATLKVRSESRIDGYLLFVQIPASAMTGFDPLEHPRLGFSYAVADRELGYQSFSLGPEYPVFDDPSLWGTLEMVS